MGDVLVILVLSVLSGMAITYLKENKDSCNGNCTSCKGTCPLSEDLKKARENIKSERKGAVKK